MQSIPTHGPENRNKKRKTSFLLVDLRELFQIKGRGDEKEKKKSSENDQMTGHFQSFFSELLFSFSELLFLTSEQTVELVKVNHKSV